MLCRITFRHFSFTFMYGEPSFFLQFLICLTLSIKLLLAADIITPSSFISDGDKLISSSERFELGFFSPGKSKYRYLGIWYKQIPDTVVWVANRNSPIFYLKAALTISKDGNLVILNQTNGTIWSSNTSRKAENPVAQLLDNGNLVLSDNFSRNTSENYLWQSFDNPTDTLLQGMKLGWDLKTGLERYQISWSSADDPSPGNFIHRLDIHVLPQLCIYNRSVKLACSGPWNGHAFAVSPFNFLYVPTIVDKEGEIYYSYDSYNSPIIMIIKISPSGKLQQLVWKERTSMWEVSFTGPSYFCQIYGRCGANSVCSTNKIPNCECLMGFKLKSQHNQTRPATCVRSHSSDCKSGDRFLKLDDMKLPDLAESSLNVSMGLKDCEAECLKNCSCTAFANSKVTGGGSGCLMWFGDLVDIRKAVYHDNAQPLYIRVPASVLEVGNKKLLWIIVILAAILFPAFYIFCQRRRKLQEKETMTGQDMLQFDIRMSITSRTNEFCQENISANGNIRYSWFPMFSLASICAATSNFSMENKLGEGGFGSVYKGRLLNGQEVAVKRLSSRSGQGLEEFKNELILIAKLQHRNLVRLLGCCTEREENILIYEYMPNKSLDFFLFDPTKSLLLGWRTRVKIIEGVAQGLLYLHQYSRLRVIHRDLKASNILLDAGMNSKISDFGMARVFGGDELQSRTKRIVGTYGYMSPEYALRGFFSIKSDVFSFGVLLFEILSGKKNTQFYNTDSLTLLGQAWDLWKVDRALDLMDPTLENEVSYPTLIRYINVALLCVHENAADRPTMSEVVSMLTNENLVLPSPKQPAFSYVRSLKNSKQPKSKPEAWSVNNVTVSLIGAR